MSKEINGINYVAATDIVKNLCISRQTFWRWRRLEKIPRGHRFRDGRVFYTIDELEKIKQYANHVEALDQSVTQQLKLFNS